MKLYIPKVGRQIYEVTLQAAGVVIFSELELSVVAPGRFRSKWLQ